MAVYNPASLHVKERLPSTVSYAGVAEEIFPPNTVFDAGNGAVVIDMAPGDATGADSGNTIPFEPVQDGADPFLWTLPNPAPFTQWVVASLCFFLEGFRLRSSLMSVGGTGNRTLRLHATVPVSLGDFLEGEGRRE